MSAIGIIGGSGLYELDGIEGLEERDILTPFGKPSDVIMGGTLHGQQVWFLPRHGKQHHLLPTEIPHRANLWALKFLGARWIISVGAVGSLKEELPPRHIVLPDQYYDRTTQRREHTFFGNGIVAHLPFGYPTNDTLRSTLSRACQELGLLYQQGGTYVSMDGPAFSTRSESEVNRQHGFDVIGMTHIAEAKLAREAEMAFASLCLVTDYDCWREHEVDVQELLSHLKENTLHAKQIIAYALQHLPTEQEEPEFSYLDSSILTPKKAWREEAKKNLAPLLERFLD